MNKGQVNCDDDYKEEQLMSAPKEMDNDWQPDKQMETILKCGTVVGSAPLSCNSSVWVPESNGYGAQPVVLATVVLDTTQLIKPTIKIDFSSLISFKTFSGDNYSLHLVFKLSKICSGSPISLGTWTFEQTAYDQQVRESQQIGCGYVQETDSFCFSWCECDEECPDCCRYIVELVDQQCYNINFVAITNISLTAMAVGLKKPHHS